MKIEILSKEKVSSLIHFLKSFTLFIEKRLKSHFFYLSISMAIALLVLNSIKVSDLQPIIGTLQNISAAVFTLAGIWVAYSYPDAIAAYTSPKSVILIPTDSTKRIEQLVLIILTSAFVISILLLHNISQLVLSKIAIGIEFKFFLKLIGISSIFYLSILQLKAIATVMITNISFVNDLHIKKTEKEADKDL